MKVVNQNALYSELHTFLHCPHSGTLMVLHQVVCKFHVMLMKPMSQFITITDQWLPTFVLKDRDLPYAFLTVQSSPRLLLMYPCLRAQPFAFWHHGYLTKELSVYTIACTFYYLVWFHVTNGFFMLRSGEHPHITYHKLNAREFLLNMNPLA